MPELDLDAPIPVLVVGVGAEVLGRELEAALVGPDRLPAFSCAGFETSLQAVDASMGASQLILIATGPDAEQIVGDSVWASWTVSGSQISRIVVLDGDVRAEFDLEPEIHRISSDQTRSLPSLARLLARLMAEQRARQRLARELAIERACEPLSACLEPGKLYTMAIDLLLSRLGRSCGIALFAPSPAPHSVGVAARGFDEETRDQICQQVLAEKSIEAAMGQGEVSVVPWGPLHHVLGRMGIGVSGAALLSVPLRGDEVEVGHVWILAEGRRFDAADLEAAHTIARRASAALTTAERYHRAKERAFIDDVTGVYNARYVLSTADNEIQRAIRYGRPLSVLFLDLDRFKMVNDRFGHLVGSNTLRTLSKLLAQCVRQVDTLARYGGDEFTILLVDTPHDMALVVAERIRTCVEEHLFEAGRQGHHRLTISIGVATCPTHGKEREPLLDASDKAMYRAKSQGRNRVCSAGEF